MYLTKAEIFSLPAEAFSSIRNLCNAVWNRFSCGISTETAARILVDYQAGRTT